MPASHTGNSGPVRAGIYCRISLAAMDDKTKVDDQERICRDLAERLAWEVSDVYQDHARSAWSKRRNRPAWNRMLDDVEAGKITGIIVYHGDRLVRQPYDLETLLNLAESKGIRLASPTGTRDLDDSSDRFVLRILTAQACMESDNTSRRRKAQYDRWRRGGRVRPGGRGGRPYGFATDGLTLVPEECEIIREMAERILSGESVSGAVRAANARGARTPAGNKFTQDTARKMLARPRLAGLMPDGESKAAWDAVLERETWERLQLTLAARGKDGNPSPSNARRHLLTGIAVCGMEDCGAPLGIGWTRGRPAYRCTSCYRVQRGAGDLDAYVSMRVVARLGNLANPQPGMPAAPDHAREWAVLARERAETEHLIADPGRSAGRAHILMARLDAIDGRMAQLRELEDTSARDRLTRRYERISLEEFRAQPLSVRRALVAATVRVTVLPASKRGPGFRTEDVRVEPA